MRFDAGVVPCESTLQALDKHDPTRSEPVMFNQEDVSLLNVMAVLLAKVCCTIQYYRHDQMWCCRMSS